jgi:MoaA/NifB/PqqE/SkfB family radical SAM enzyme
MFYHYDDIQTIHLEITERCNAGCPQCNRNINGGEMNPYLSNTELSLTDIKQIIPVELIKQLTHIYMCGNYGDPIIAQDTLDVFKYFREHNPNLLLSMNTNGSARTLEWWRELALVLGDKGYVIFSIDGLEDTNHIYRRNTNYNKIIENAKIFIENNGIAYWEFIVFKHNEHQVELAENTAKKLGFSKFQVKKTARFISGLSGSIKASSNFIDRKGSKIEIAMPTNSMYRNEVMEQVKENLIDIPFVTVPTTYEEIKDNLNPELFNHPLIPLYDKTKIDCKVKKEKSLYISAEGIVQPCCWMASTMYSWYHMPKRTQIWKYINKVGLNKLNAKKYSIKDIVESEYFTLVEESWNKPTCSQGKLTVCARTCGKDLETFSKQYI